jgi:hypothetical protein
MVTNFSVSSGKKFDFKLYNADNPKIRIKAISVLPEIGYLIKKIIMLRIIKSSFEIEKEVKN